MGADRAAAGLGGAAVMIAVAFAPKGVSVVEGIFLGLAVLVLAVAFAPILPGLNRLPKVGAPAVSVVLSFEPLNGDPTELAVTNIAGIGAQPQILRVGFVNAGPRRVHRTLINILVPEAVGLVACDHTGDTSNSHGRSMPATVLDDVPTRFWADKDVDLPVGALLMHYKLSFPDPAALGSAFRIRVTYDSDDLYGGERISEETVPVLER
jgi:hypothetical protein